MGGGQCLRSCNLESHLYETIIMSLIALEIKSISYPEDKKIKKFDGNGLFLLIKNNVSKLCKETLELFRLILTIPFIVFFPHS